MFVRSVLYILLALSALSLPFRYGYLDFGKDPNCEILEEECRRTVWGYGVRDSTFAGQKTRHCFIKNEQADVIRAGYDCWNVMNVEIYESGVEYEIQPDALWRIIFVLDTINIIVLSIHVLYWVYSCFSGPLPTEYPAVRPHPIMK